MSYFGLKGKKVRIVKGEYEGEKGTILEETGYVDGRGGNAKICYLDKK